MEYFDFNIDNYTLKDMLRLLNIDSLKDESFTIKHISDSFLQNKIDKKVDLISHLDNITNNEVNKIKYFLTDIKYAILEKKYSINNDGIENVNTDSNLNPEPGINTVSVTDKIQRHNKQHSFKPFFIYHNHNNQTYQHKSIRIRDLHLNSLFRQNKNDLTTDFLYNLPTPMKNVMSMRLNSISIPNTWFTINKKNNKLKVNDTIFELPIGNYHYENIKCTFENIVGCNDSGIEIDHCPLTNRYTISSKYNDIFKLTFIENENTHSIGHILGFKYSFYEGSNSYTGEYVSQMNGDEYVYVCINDFQNNYTNKQIVCLKDNTIDNYVLAKVYLTHEKFFVNIEDNVESLSLDGKKRIYDGPVDITKLKITVLNQFGDIVDINGNNISLTLQIIQTYN